MGGYGHPNRRLRVLLGGIWLWLVPADTGGFLWLIAGVMMKDKPIIATNALMNTVGIIGKLFG